MPRLENAIVVIAIAIAIVIAIVVAILIGVGLVNGDGLYNLTIDGQVAPLKDQPAGRRGPGHGCVAAGSRWLDA